MKKFFNMFLIIVIVTMAITSCISVPEENRRTNSCRKMKIIGSDSISSYTVIDTIFKPGDFIVINGNKFRIK